MTTPALPEAIAPFVRSAVKAIAMQLDEGKEVLPTWFLINREIGSMAPLVIPFENPEQKYCAAEMARHAAYQLQCDCVVFFCESWGLKTPTRERFEEIRAAGGQIRNEPDAYDCMLISIETYDGVWAAYPAVTTRGKHRILGPIEYMGGPDLMAAGTMSNYLPPKPGTTVQ